MKQAYSYDNQNRQIPVRIVRNNIITKFSYIVFNLENRHRRHNELGGSVQADQGHLQVI